MSQRKSNVFLVFTQYHLMISVNIIFDRFKEYNNIIYFSDNGRMDLDNKSSEEFIHLIKIKKGDEIQQKYIDEIVSSKPERFFIFQEDNIEIHYLTYMLSKKGIKIALAQDGNKPYCVIKKDKLFLSIVRDNYYNYLFMFKRRKYIYNYGFYNKYKYGTLKQLDEIWLTHPEAFIKTSKKPIVKNPDFSKASIDYLVKLFGFDSNIDLQNIFFYIAKPLKEDYWNTEYEILKSILASKINVRIIYKTHPNQSPKMLEYYNNFNNVELLYDKTPAELYIFNISNSVVMGINSAAMITYNPSNQYINISQLFKGGRYFTQYTVQNPVTHIKNVSSMEELTSLCFNSANN